MNKNVREIGLAYEYKLAYDGGRDEIRLLVSVIIEKEDMA